MVSAARIQERTTELTSRIRTEVMPEHRRRCEEREEMYPNSVRFDDEIFRMLQSNPMVAEVRRLQRMCQHLWTGYEVDTTWSVPAKTKRCTICQSNETAFGEEGAGNE